MFSLPFKQSLFDALLSLAPMSLRYTLTVPKHTPMSPGAQLHHWFQYSLLKQMTIFRANDRFAVHEVNHKSGLLYSVPEAMLEDGKT